MWFPSPPSGRRNSLGQSAETCFPYLPPTAKSDTRVSPSLKSWGIISNSAAHIRSSCWDFTASALTPPPPVHFPLTIIHPSPHLSLFSLQTCLPVFSNLSPCLLIPSLLLPVSLTTSPPSPLILLLLIGLSPNPSFSSFWLHLFLRLPTSNTPSLLFVPSHPLSGSFHPASALLFLITDFLFSYDLPHSTLPILSHLSGVLSPCWAPAGPEIQSDNAGPPITLAEGSFLQNPWHRRAALCGCTRELGEVQERFGARHLHSQTHTQGQQHNIGTKKCHNLMFLRLKSRKQDFIQFIFSAS